MYPNILVSKDYSVIKIVVFQPLRAEKNSPDKNNSFSPRINKIYKSHKE